MEEEIAFLKQSLFQKEQELDQINQIFKEFQQQSQELEDVLSKQSDLFEEELQQEKLRSSLIEQNYLQKMAQMKLQVDQELSQKDEEFIKLQKEKEFYQNLYQKITQKPVLEKGLEKLEFTKENFDSLKEQLEIKNQALSSLEQEVQSNRSLLAEQKNLFKELNSKIEDFKVNQQQRISDIEKIKDTQIEILENQLKQSNIKNDQLTRKNKEGTNEVTQEEIDQMRKMVSAQNQQLKEINEDFQAFRIQANQQQQNSETTQSESEGEKNN